MNLGAIAAKFTGVKAGEVIAKVMEKADNLFTSKEEKMKLENDLLEAMSKAEESQREHILMVLKAEFADLENARQREIDLAKDEHTPLINKIITPILAIVIVVTTFTLWGMILFRHYEPKSSESMIIGSLTTICASVIGYYFGSSTGSHAKQKQLDKMQSKG